LINQSISQIEKNPVNLPEHYTKQIVDLLNTDLASHFILFFQFKKQHWIVEGPDWKHISTALDEYAKTIQGLAELLAEIKPTRSYTIIKSITIQKLSYVQFEGEDKHDLRKMIENDLIAEQQLIPKIRERIDFARENRDHGIDDLLKDI
jgi:starvation-inducible DNA-binding protein